MNEQSNTQVIVEQAIHNEMYSKYIETVTELNRMYWYNARELAEYYGVSVGSIYVWIHKGYFPVLHQGGRYYVHQSTIEWIDRLGKELIVAEKRLFPKLVHTAVSIGSIALPEKE